MDDAVRAREAARDALEDIEPPRLREALDARLADASMTPGALTLLTARVLAGDAASETDTDGLAERAAGVQLIYEGLRLTRHLAHEEPWTAAYPADRNVETDTTEGGQAGDIAADLDILAADVFVSRGFFLLARTEAADQAVETVRRFGRNETRRRSEGADVASLDRNLESDVLVLAMVAGTSAAGHEAPDALIDYAERLVDEFEGEHGLPPAATALPESAEERIIALSEDDDRVPSSVTDP